jgi:hypothetical protein
VAAVEATATVATVAETARDHARRENPGGQGSVERGRRGNGNEVHPAPGGNNDSRAEAARATERGGRQPSPGFADITVSPRTKQYVHIASLFLIFGSYLYLRLRKAKLKKQPAKSA